MNTTLNVLNAALSLAADAGVDIDPDALYVTTRQAGTLIRPRDDSPDTTAWQAAALDLVLAEAALAPAYAARGLTPYDIVGQMRMCAYIASRILPATLVDVFDRYTLSVDDETGELPRPEQVEWALGAALCALRGYVNERDAGQWIDTYVLSGSIADVHDAARMIIAAHDINGTGTGCSDEQYSHDNRC